MTDLQAHEIKRHADSASLPDPAPSLATPSFPIVGLVGAAGSRQALELFFRNLPNDCGMAFVVVTRLAAKQQQQLAAAIEARTEMPVMMAADGAALQIDHIYLAPPGVALTLAHDGFRLQHAQRKVAQDRLDQFLATLATTQGENAVAILFSGAGEDGIGGLQQVKAGGGMVLVQDPEEAAHPALPRRAVATGKSDLVATAGELAQRLVQIKGDLANAATPPPLATDETFSELFTAILTQITTQTGHDLSHYKASTLQRRIARRLQIAGLQHLTQYLDLLKSNPKETQSLFRDCLVSVTSFFRDPDAYLMLERDCIPQLFLNKGRSDFVRVWVAGCATGEEAYSVAIQLAERAAQMPEPPRFQVFATDLDEAAISVARRGLYPATIAKQMAPSRLQRYFSEENSAYRVKPEIREQVLFAAHDLLKDPPFSRLDLICCRNVLIYFNREAQEKVFDTFHYALQPGGYLFLGTSESGDSAPDLFAVLNKHCHLYQRRDVIGAASRRTQGAATPTALATPGGKATERTAQRPTTQSRTVEELYTAWTLRVHAPPRLLVNDNYDITHLFGGADRYLQERDGAITQNVLQKILPDLRLDLRAALYQAFNKSERTISRLIRVNLAGKPQMVQLHVGPITEPGFPQEYVEVAMVTQEDPALLGLTPFAEAVEADLSLVARMEEELLRTRERLQTIIEEYEVSSQELKTSNEELQSINEELKSTTEELETSKEELQSMNEELVTVNSELTRKVEELYRANSDLLNLIASTDVGAIFLDNALQVKRFTPRATELFNLIEGDIGRPFAHVTHRLRHSGVADMTFHVQTTATRLEETVQRNDDHWFILRMFPYRTITGEIDGVVITFVDINDLKRAESEERQRRQQQSLAELSRQALADADLDALLTAATHQVAQVLEMELCKVLQLQPDGETFLLQAGVGWNEGLVGQATVPADRTTQAGYTLHALTPVVVRDLRTETRFRTVEMLLEHAVRSGMSVTIPGGAGAYGVLSVHSRQVRAFATYDIDFLQAVANLLAAAILRRRTEAAVRASEERFRSLIEQASDAIFIANLDGVYTDVNSSACRLLGYERAELIGKKVSELIPAADRPTLEATQAHLFATYETQVAEWTLVRKDGTPILTEVSAKVLPNGIWQTIVRDITERKQAEVLLSRYQLLSEQTRDIILFMRLDGQIVDANAAAVAAYGYDYATLLTMQIRDLRDPATTPLVAAQLAQAEASGLRFETRHRRQDGTTFPVEVSSIGADIGGERLLLSIIRDSTERKQTEAALAASEAKFATAFSLSPLFLTITTLADGRLIEINESFVRLTGYTRAEALGRTPAELALWAEPQQRVDGLARLRTEGNVQDVEADFRMKDGSIRTCLLGASIIEINGQPCALTALTDITERKQAEAALRASEDRLQRVLDSITAFAGILTPEGQIVDINRAAREIAKLNIADLRGRPFEEGFWFAHSPPLQAQIRDSITRAAAGETVRFDIKAQIGANHYLDVDYAIGPVRDRNGTITHLVPSGLDITERKQAAQALQASAAQLRLVTDNVSGLISYVDRNERYRFVNAVYDAWFAQPSPQLIGHTVQETLGDVAYAVAQPHIAQALAGKRITFENTIAYPDGVTRTVLTTYVPDIAGDGQILGFYALVTDITERKQAEERLRFLAEASSILASSLDYAVTLENVAHAAVPGIADWCTIDLLDEDGALQGGVIAHVDPAKIQWAEELRNLYPVDMNSPMGAPHVIRTGQSEFYPMITDTMLQAVAKNAEELQLLRSVGYRSVIIAPLQAHGRVLGAITFVASESERHFTPDDLTMAEELARRAAAAIGNAQLHRAVQQREQQLHASEERLRLATEAGKIGIYDHDLLTKHTTYSDIYLAITGIKPEEELTRDAWLTRVHPADRATVAEKLQRAMADGESYDYEYRIYRPDGELRWLGISSRVSVDETGRAVRLTGALSDITERKQAEEEIQRLNRDLRRRLDELQSLLDVAPIGIFVAHDPACEVITSNAVGAEMLGIRATANASKSGATANELPFRVFQNGRELLPEELPMQYAVTHDRAVHNLEVDIVRADGSVVNLYEYALPLHDEEGKVRGCLGIFVDITARKEAEASLRASEERFRSAFEQAAVGMAHVSLDGHYLRVNDRLCEILGYQREALLNKNFLDLTHPADHARSLTLSEELLAGRIPSYSTEKRYLRSDGAMTWVNLTASIVREAEGEVMYRLAVIEDISARKAAEIALRELTATLDQRVKERTAELERSNQELDQFAYVASHDLKAPLRAIVNLASWIVEDAGAQLPAPSLEHLEKLRGRALRMERLLDDLLTYSRLGRRDGVVEGIKTDLLIQDTLYLLAPPASFTIRVTGELPVLLTPRTPLELVFRNLISNAIKHHHQPEKGIIQIHVQDRGDFVEFAVSDNGPGIPSEYHERIFGMFQTLRPRDEVEGSGMGLAIVRRAVEYRGGVIQVESAEDSGTTFRFTWPKRTAQTTTKE